MQSNETEMKQSEASNLHDDDIKQIISSAIHQQSTSDKSS